MTDKRKNTIRSGLTLVVWREQLAGVGVVGRSPLALGGEDNRIDVVYVSASRRGLDFNDHGGSATGTRVVCGGIEDGIGEGLLGHVGHQCAIVSAVFWGVLEELGDLRRYLLLWEIGA